MLFNSYTFLVFFVLVLLVSRWIRSWSLRKSFLLLVSYLFYAAWNPPFVILLWISTVGDWFIGSAMYRATSRARRKSLLLMTLVLNLGMLSYFKYGGFILENFRQLMLSVGWEVQFAEPDIILPVGISFYTFQTLSYTLDIYRGTLAPWHSFRDYALFVTFFPQLVAGPIVRSSDFLPQCEQPKTGSRDQLAWGLTLLVIGLFAKVVVADALTAPVVAAVYDSTAQPGFFPAWTGTIAFALQIFADFFGYSTCAIGVALCLGFELPDNFRSPYAARGFSDFWQRWHITLSSWLRDYLYISLGGNRSGVARTYLNLMLTMLLGGLWHGASWLFVIWGGLHGVYLVAERLVRRSSLAAWAGWGTWLGKGFLTLSTFGLVDVAWVFFRAQDLDRASAICGAMLNPFRMIGEVTARIAGDTTAATSVSMGLYRMEYLTIFALTALVLWGQSRLRDSSLEEQFGGINWIARSAVLALMIFSTILCMSGEDSAFIYFQF